LVVRRLGPPQRDTLRNAVSQVIEQAVNDGAQIVAR
jgi:hypothetical protein